jgi:hypothetical protein
MTPSAPDERSYLIRCLVGLLATGIVIGAIDLAACRVRTPASCSTIAAAVAASVTGAAGWIGGILTKSPQ